MKTIKMMIVGGTFNKKDGKSSYFVSQIIEHYGCKAINGGNVKELYEFRPHNIDILFWLPNIDNLEDKILPRLKIMNPKMILVSSKRVIEKQYSNYELVTRAINVKANLCLIVRKINNRYAFSIIDPLGNIFCTNYSLNGALAKLTTRLSRLLKVKRVPSKQLEFDPYPEVDIITADFIKVVKFFGNKFSNIIQANNPDRFLGNASTRCEWGFPSIKRDNCILVSKRNVNKESITEDNFVKAYLINNKVGYIGPNKPSIDTPIQLQLYKMFPNIRYIIHGHCYIEEAPYTRNKFPCGDLREVEEIKNTVGSLESNFYVINLFGHGCLIMTKHIADFYKVKLIERPMLEK